MLGVKKDFTIIGTHSMQQAARASDYRIFYLGDLIGMIRHQYFQNAKLQSTN